MSTSIWDKWKEKMQTASSAMSRLVSAKPKTLTTKDTDATTAATAVDSQNLQTTPAAQNTTTQTTNTQNNTGDDRFLQWYKQQFGKDYTEGSFNKTDGISDKDYEIGNNLYQAYLQKQNLQKQHDSAIQAVDQSTAKQRQEASILRDKMAKYLNLQNKNSGLNNLGVSESVGLQADSQYLTNLGTIESNANTEKTNLQNNLQNNQTSIDTNTASNEQSILDKYQQYAREDEQKEYERKKYEEELAYQKEQDEYEKKKYEEERDYQREQDEYNKKLYEEEKKEAQDQTDNDNAYVVAQATLEELIASGNYEKARQYLEENKGVFGDKVYNTYTSQIGTSEITSTTQSSTDSVNTFLAGSYGSVSDTYAKYKNIMKNLDENYQKGLISETDYNNLKDQMNSTTTKSCNGGWYVQGLGSGRKNDDIDITIGSSSRKGNGATEYDLKCGSAVTDKDIKKQLNKLATGSEDSTPARRNDKWGWLLGDKADSKNTDGKLVVFMNQMFIYTEKGWVTVESDHSDIQDAINAFLGK